VKPDERTHVNGRENRRDSIGIRVRYGVAIIVALIAAYGAYRANETANSVKDVTRSNCHQIELLKGTIRVVVARSLLTLGKPGTAGYEYYFEHPAELANAKAQLVGELQQFASRRC
jgi:hypothetical protein